MRTLLFSAYWLAQSFQAQVPFNAVDKPLDTQHLPLVNLFFHFPSPTRSCLPDLRASSRWIDLLCAADRLKFFTISLHRNILRSRLADRPCTQVGSRQPITFIFFMQPSTFKAFFSFPWSSCILFMGFNFTHLDAASYVFLHTLLPSSRLIFAFSFAVQCTPRLHAKSSLSSVVIHPYSAISLSDLSSSRIMHLCVSQRSLCLYTAYATHDREARVLVGVTVLYLRLLQLHIVDNTLGL